MEQLDTDNNLLGIAGTIGRNSNIEGAKYTRFSFKLKTIELSYEIYLCGPV